MPRLLDEAGDGAGGLLDEFDADLAGQMDRLTRPRKRIAASETATRIRTFPRSRHRSSPCSSPSAFHQALAEVDRGLSVLLAHLVGKERTHRPTGYYEQLTAPGTVSATTTFSERSARLGLGSTEEDVSCLIEEFMTPMAPVIEGFVASETSIDLEASADIFTEYSADLLNTQQREVLERL
ncbi:hypothetical protein [Streptomyces sp. NPDC005989]|uniref:hypothetical protein n=1 Tax=Streptomyces sp. NPDC005989 TaxID=3156727 RepID=UPI0033F68638